MREYAVYILVSQRNGTLYVGVTGELKKRIWQHKKGQGCIFTAKYNVVHLVYYSFFSDIKDAIAAEKQIKGWRRSKKIALIEEFNPNWNDLAPSLLPPLSS